MACLLGRTWRLGAVLWFSVRWKPAGSLEGRGFEMALVRRPTWSRGSGAGWLCVCVMSGRRYRQSIFTKRRPCTLVRILLRFYKHMGSFKNFSLSFLHTAELDTNPVMTIDKSTMVSYISCVAECKHSGRRCKDSLSTYETRLPNC